MTLATSATRTRRQLRSRRRVGGGAGAGSGAEAGVSMVRGAGRTEGFPARRRQCGRASPAIESRTDRRRAARVESRQGATTGAGPDARSRRGVIARRATPPTGLLDDECHLTKDPPMKAVIAAYARSPFHFAKKGALAGMRPDTLAAQVVGGLLKRLDLDPALLEDVIMGCAYPEGAQGNNIARIVGLLAGLPHHVGGMTVNRFCGSSMQAVHIAAAQIEAGAGEAFLCVGVESMTMVPQGGFNFSPNPELKANTAAYLSMGETAENVAQRWN